MYGTVADPYCYPGTTVLRNRLGLTDQALLDAFELDMTTQRASEPLPAGRLSYSHYRAVHRHLFQDVYGWAGRPRTVRIAKGQSTFAYPEHIDREMRRIFRGLRDRRRLRGLSRDAFARGAAAFLAEVNAVHPFREGNGRTQLAFLALLAYRAGHALDLERLDPRAMLSAMIESFAGGSGPLAAQIEGLMA